MPGGQRVLIARVQGNLHLALRQQSRATRDPLDAIGAEQCGDAVSQVANHLVLARHHGLEVERDVVGDDAVAHSALAQTAIKLGTLQQRLGRDAAGVKAGTTQGRRAGAVSPVIDTGSLHAELGTADRGHVAGRPPTDHDHVVISVQCASPIRDPAACWPDLPAVP